MTEAEKMREMLRVAKNLLGETLDKDFGFWSAPNNVKYRHAVYGAYKSLVEGDAIELPAPEPQGVTEDSALIAQCRAWALYRESPFPDAARTVLVEAADRLALGQSQPRKVVREEFGWVIELGRSEVSAPEYWCGNGWSKDNLRAIRFARKVDAENEASGWDDDPAPEIPYRIAEHGWS